MVKDTKPEDLGIRLVSKEQGLWEEIREQAQGELAKLEDNYFKSKTFNEGVIEIANFKIDEIERQDRIANARAQSKEED